MHVYLKLISTGVLRSDAGGLYCRSLNVTVKTMTEVNELDDGHKSLRRVKLHFVSVSRCCCCSHDGNFTSAQRNDDEWILESWVPPRPVHVTPWRWQRLFNHFSLVLYKQNLRGSKVHNRNSHEWSCLQSEVLQTSWCSNRKMFLI